MQKKAYKKRKFKKTYKKIKALNLWMGTIAKRKIQIDIPIYVRSFAAGDPNWGQQDLIYTFDGAGTATTTSLVNKLGQNVLYIQLLKAYNYFQLTGMKLQYQRVHVDNQAIFSGQSILSLPPVSFFPDGLGETNPGRVYDYDNAYKIQTINEDSNSYARYYKFPTVQAPRAAANASSNFFLGNVVWQTTGTGNIAGEFFLAMGFPFAGKLAANAGGNAWRLVGNLRVTYYTKWCMPKIASA